MKSIALIPLDSSGLNDDILSYEGNTLHCLKRYFEKKGYAFHTIDRYSSSALHDAVITMDITSMFDAYKQTVRKNQKKRPVQIFLLSECPAIGPRNWDLKEHAFFDAIFTWRDDWVDNQHYFKWTWIQNGYRDFPRKISMEELLKEKSCLLTLVNAKKYASHPDELYSERVKAITFFQRRIPADFDLYGRGWDKPLPVNPFNLHDAYSKLTSPGFLRAWVTSLTTPPLWRGAIDDKFTILRKYRFAICYENMNNIQGYVTEKIWDCFRVRTIPIYLGADNIGAHIPEDCFIDKRKFTRYDDLLSFITSMDDEVYSTYVRAIDAFVKEQKMKDWFDEYFAKKVGGAIWSIIQKHKR